GRLRASESASADGGFDRVIYHRKVKGRSWLCGSAANSIGSTRSSTVIDTGRPSERRTGAKRNAWNANGSSSSKVEQQYRLQTVARTRPWTSRPESTLTRKSVGHRFPNEWLRTG